jgi:hypothetical protein
MLASLLLIVAAGGALACLLFVTCWRTSRLEFLMPELLDAPSSLIAQTTRDRAIALGFERQASLLVTNTLAYVALANQLVAQGLTRGQADARLRVQKNGKVWTFVPMSATSVAAERQGLLK